MENPQEEYYIQNAKPDTDCIYCEVQHYRNGNGTGFAPEQYAQCKCPAICRGMEHVDITFRADPFGLTTSCQKCKHYKGRRQLTLF